MKSEVDVIVKVNAVDVPKDFYQSGDTWHLTLGMGRWTINQSWYPMSLEQQLNADIAAP